MSKKISRLKYIWYLEETQFKYKDTEQLKVKLRESLKKENKNQGNGK